MGTKVFFTAVAQPNPQHLWNPLFFCLSQTVVEIESPIALPTASRIVVGIPIAAGNPDAPTDFFNQGFSGQSIIGLRLGLRHR